MPGPYIVGVDCGTQSAKVVIFESNGHVVAEGNQTQQVRLQNLLGGFGRRRNGQ